MWKERNPVNQTRFIILGAGNIAAHFVDAVRQTGQGEVVAVASRSGARARDFAAANGIPQSYGDYAEMLEKVACDCAYVATVPSSHAQLCRLCLDHGRPVLCEKTMFRNYAEASEIFALAQAKGLFIMEAMWSKFLPAIRTARRWLEEGRIGQPRFVDVAIGFAAPTDPEGRYFNRELGGGVALDITVYAYQLVPFLLPYDWQVEAVRVVRGPTGTDDSEALLLRAGPCLATLRTSFMADLDDHLTIYGDRGRLTIPRPHMAKEAFLAEERFTDDQTRNGLVYEIEEVIRCLREGRTQSETQPMAATLEYAGILDFIARQ